MGAFAPSPNASLAGSWELPKSEQKKIGGGVAVPEHFGQTNYAEICILVTKYILKLNKILITCRVDLFNYVYTPAV